MVFSSITFVMVFLPSVLLISLLLYFLFRSRKDFTLSLILNIFLLFASLIFYSWGEFAHLHIMLSVAVVDYIFAILINRMHKKHQRLILIITALAINLAILGFYKYMNFFSANISSVMQFILPNSLSHLPITNIILPLGISFYTFQGMSYLIDVYRKDIEPDKNFINFACYLTMFPQLVAGPIVRYASIQKELKLRVITLDRFTDGTIRFIYGLAKKILIADTMGRVADVSFAMQNGELTALAAWIGIICYTLQIYYDFSAYSDMAIGIGMMLGFTFPENFDYPYISKNITEFWRRWHMSLSTWFRDYLYIPLGGNRKGRLRTYLNLMIVFVLCGFWHGASLIFVGWGLYYGIFLVAERVAPNVFKKVPAFIKHIYAVFLIMFGWIIFRSADFTQVFYYFKSLTNIYKNSVNDSMIILAVNSGDFIISFILAIILSMPLYRRVKSFFDSRNSFALRSTFRLSEMFFALVVLMITLLPLFGSTYKSFIYFRF